MVALLVTALVILLLLMVVKEVLGLLALSPRIQTLIMLILVLLALLWFVERAGLVAGLASVR